MITKVGALIGALGAFIELLGGIAEYRQSKKQVPDPLRVLPETKGVK